MSNEIFYKFKGLTKKKKIYAILMLLISLFSIFLLSLFLVDGFFRNILKLSPIYEDKPIFYFAINDQGALILSLIVFFLIIILILFVITRRDLSNRISFMDERGVGFAQKATHGSSRWMNIDEAKDIFEVSDIKKTDTIIYGQLSDKGKRVVGYKPGEVATGNKNLLLLGSPGTGKSYSYVRTSLIQACLRGESIICTDPSGELINSLYNFLNSKGYEVKVLNLQNPAKSDFWNCLNEVIDPETKRISGTRLNEFADIYMENSSNSDRKEDPFWEGNAKEVLKASIGYVMWIKEKWMLEKYIELYKQVSVLDPNRDFVLSNQMKIDDFSCTFSWCEQIIQETADKYDFDLNDIFILLKEIEDNSPSASISEVYDTIMDFKAVKQKRVFESMPKNYPGKDSYLIHSSSSEIVQDQSIQGMQLRMAPFVDKELLSALSFDGIELSKINMKPNPKAYFVCISDRSTSTKPISSLFFSFFFKEALDNYTTFGLPSEEIGGENPCLPVTVMLDEFFSIGVIGGNKDMFATYIANVRKYKVFVNVIVQNITQISTLYGKENSNTIQTCCDTLMFLGCNDPETAEYISNFVSGEATILNERHGESQSILGGFAQRMDGIQVTTAKRQLITIGEAREWKNKVLIAKRGEHPLELKIFGWKEHPLYIKGLITPSAYLNNIEHISVRASRFKQKMDNNLKEDINICKTIQMLIPKSETMYNRFIDAISKGQTKKKMSDKKEKRENTQIKLDFDDCNIESDDDKIKNRMLRKRV